MSPTQIQQNDEAEMRQIKVCQAVIARYESAMKAVEETKIRVVRAIDAEIDIYSRCIDNERKEIEGINRG